MGGTTDMDHVLKVGDEVLATQQAPVVPSPASPQPSGGSRFGGNPQLAGCLTAILLLAGVGVSIWVAQAVFGIGDPKVEPARPPTASTISAPVTTAVPPATSAVVPTSTTLPVGGVQPPAEVIPIPGSTPDPDGNGGEPPPSTHQENTCGHPDC